jgi:ElaA protein
MIHIVVKGFDQLSTSELYDILQLRSEVFVVEQNCVYQDLDGKDLNALHIMGYKNKKIVAYTRVFKPNDYFENASIGRVVVSKDQRKHKYGIDIMKASIKAIEEHFNETKIVLSAQTYLKHFYNSLDFEETGKEYLEDGIPHIKMIKD